MKQGIGWAVKEMHDGKKVRRSGWNGKGMWIALVFPVDGDSPSGLCSFINAQAPYPTLPFVAMKTADNALVPWLCSQTDLLALDWELVE